MGDQTSREVYKYRLLPQSSVGPNLPGFATPRKFLTVQGVIRCSEPMISSSTFGSSVLFSVLTRTEHIMIIQVSQFLLGDRCVAFSDYGPANQGGKAFA